ncbi:hypothetical protein BYT27DRAFT_7282653 [Phlegmacium glaucopus]|nr:hypothetical protein BYT27DRAFT_7282653 [Phlegmacium glaucopus]
MLQLRDPVKNGYRIPKLQHSDRYPWPFRNFSRLSSSFRTTTTPSPVPSLTIFQRPAEMNNSVTEPAILRTTLDSDGSASDGLEVIKLPDAEDVFDPENYGKMEREEKMLRPYKNGGKWGHCRIYEKEVLHAGICLIEPELFRGSDPNKVFNQEIELIHDLVEPIEVSDLNLKLGDKCKIWAGEGGLSNSRVPVSLFPSSAEPLLAKFQLTGTANVVEIPTNFITISILRELGLRYGRHNPHGQDVKDCRDEKEVQNDILQEMFINTTAGWVNLLLLSSSGPNGRPHTCKSYSSMPIFTIELEPWRLRGAQILWRGRPQGATPVAHSVALLQLDEATPDSTHEYRCPALLLKYSRGAGLKRETPGILCWSIYLKEV